jgi:hypothetical protein
MLSVVTASEIEVLLTATVADPNGLLNARV